MTALSIGQLAGLVGMKVEAVRFYERRGLIASPPRNAAGYRQYPAEVIARLRFIRRAQKLGFSLGEIEELLTLHEGPDGTCAQARSRANAKMMTIEAKIRDLRKIRDALQARIDECSGEGPLEDCPILAYLDLDREP